MNTYQQSIEVQTNTNNSIFVTLLITIKLDKYWGMSSQARRVVPYPGCT